MRKLTLLLFFVLLASVYAATPNPGHDASRVGAGTFSAGNYTFPNSLIVNGSLLSVNSLLGYVGIGTLTPAQTLSVVGTANISGAVYIPNTVCTTGQVLSTNSAGLLACILNTGLGGNITGVGVANYSARWTNGTNIGTGIIFDNTTNVGVGTSAPNATLHVVGSANISSTLYAGGAITGANGLTISAGTVSLPASQIDSVEIIASAINSTKLNVTNSPGSAGQILGWNTNGQFTWVADNAGLGGNITGSGVANYVGRWTNGTNFGTGLLYDSGTNVGVGTAAPNATLHVVGTGNITSTLYVGGTLSIPSPFTLGGTSMTSTATQLNYLNAATGTSGTTSSSLVFSASPTLSGTVSGGTFSGGTWNGGVIGLLYGGTNSALAAVAGGIVFSNSTGFNISSAGSSGSLLTSGGTGSPTWTAQSSLGLSHVHDTANITSGTLGVARGGTGTATYTTGIVVSPGTTTALTTVAGTNNYVLKWSSSYPTTTSLIYDNGSGVGIGTTAPAQTLSIVGTANISGAVYIPNSVCGANQVLTTNSAGLISCVADNTGFGGNVTGSGVANYVGRWTNGTNFGTGLLFDNATNVGIGTAAPNATLHVVGTANISSSLFVGGAISGASTITSASTLTASNGFTVSAGAVSLPAGSIDSLDILSAAINSTKLNTSNTGSSGQILTYNSSGGLNWSTLAASSGGNVTGSGVANYVGRWTNGTNFGTGLLFDNATNVGIGTAAPNATLHVIGSANITGVVTFPTYPCAGNQVLSTTSAGTLQCVAAASVSSAGGWTNTSGLVNLTTVTNNVSANTLFIDNTNARVGIGNAMPNSTLHVVGTANISSSLYAGGAITSASTITATSTLTASNGFTVSGGTVSLPANSIDSIDIIAAAINSTKLNTTNPPGSTGQILSWNTNGQFTWVNDNAGLGGNVTGSGVANYVGKWSNGTNFGTGLLYDSGTNVGVGTAAPNATLHVVGTGNITSTLYVGGAITGANGLTISSGTVSLPQNQIDSVEIIAAAINSTKLNTTNPPGGVGQVLSLAANGQFTWTDVSGGLGGNITGVGVGNYSARWTNGTNIGTGIIFDNTTNVGIGDTTPTNKLDVTGSIGISDVTVIDSSGNWQGGVIGLTKGGSNSVLTAVAGGIVFSNSTGFNVASAGSSGSLLTSAGAGSPTWTAQSSLGLSHVHDTANITSGTLIVARGGTGVASVTAYMPLVGGTTTTGVFQSVATGSTTGQALTYQGASAIPTFAALNLAGGANIVSGILPVANGGTNSAPALSAGGIVFSNTTGFNVASAGSSGSLLTSAGAGTPTWTAQSALANTHTHTVANLSDVTNLLNTHTHNTANLTSGTLGVARGGTGTATYTKGIVVAPGTTTALTTVAGTDNYIPKWSSSYPTTTSSIYDNGNVGIGTTTVNQKLVVAGDINATGNIYYGGNLTGYGADFAERFTIAEAVNPGDVVCLRDDMTIERCREHAARSVVGVVSTKATIIGNADAPNSVPVGIVGIVPTKVRGPVTRFDLLTTSPEGYAEKAATTDVGATIGKAMEPCSTAVCTIKVLITLS